MTENHIVSTNILRTSLIAGLLILVVATVSSQNDTVFLRYDNNSFGDNINYKTDTIVFETPNARQILYGTTVLPNTVHQQFAKNSGLYLDQVSITNCKPESGKRPDELNQVVSVSESKDSLTIETKIWGNCCHSFLCDLQVVDGNTINLIIHGYGATYCSCTCCFGLTFHISTLKVDEYKNLKMIMINSNSKTLRAK